MNRDDARPLRSVVFAPGDDADALASTRASGADSMVVDLEEPQTPYPESERERGRKVAREFFDSLVPGELPAGVRRVQPPSTGQTLKDLRAVAGPGLAGVLLPKIQSPADVHTLDALLTCTEVDFELDARAARHLPDPRDRAGDPARVRDRDRVAAGVAHGRRAVALRRHPPGARLPLDRGGRGDAVPALEGARRRQGRRASATRSAACGAARSTTSTACAPSRPALRNLGYYGMMLGSAEHVPLVHEVFTPTADEIAYWRELDELASRGRARRQRPDPPRRSAPGRGARRAHRPRRLGPQEPGLGPRPRRPRLSHASASRVAGCGPSMTQVRSGGGSGDGADELEDPGGRQVLLEHLGAERSQRVGDGVAQRGGRADGTAFPDAAEVERALRC